MVTEDTSTKLANQIAGKKATINFLRDSFKPIETQYFNQMSTKLSSQGGNECILSLTVPAFEQKLSMLSEQ